MWRHLPGQAWAHLAVKSGEGGWTRTTILQPTLPVIPGSKGGGDGVAGTWSLHPRWHRGPAFEDSCHIWSDIDAPGNSPLGGQEAAEAGQSALGAQGGSDGELTRPCLAVQGQAQSSGRETEAVSPADGSSHRRKWEAGRGGLGHAQVARCRNHPASPQNACLHLASTPSSWLKAVA